MQKGELTSALPAVRLNQLAAKRLFVSMNASQNNAGLEFAPERTAPIPAIATRSAPESAGPGHEALQALLAFSSLHEQIRQRRAQELSRGVQFSIEDVRQLEQFVLDEVLQLVAERAVTITGADGVAIALAEGNAIVCRASAGRIAPDPGARLDPTSGFSGACLASGHIVRCDDSEADTRVDVAACRRLGTRSMVAVPLAAKRTIVGLLEAFSDEAYGFNDSDVRSLNLLAELILSAMRPEDEDRLAEISRRVVGPVEQVVDRPNSPELPLETTPAAAIEVKVPDAAATDISEGDAPVAEETETLADEEKESAAASEVAAAVTEAEPEAPRVLAEDKAAKSARPGLAVVVALVLFAVGLGGGLWWNIRHNVPSPMAKTHEAALVPRQDPQPTVNDGGAPAPSAASLLPQSTNLESADDNASTSATSNDAAAQEAGVLPGVTGIRHWSSAGSSTVVVDLQDQVQYEAHRLNNPERIYFDLHDTRLAADLMGKRIEVGDPLLRQIRVAQPLAGVTRVVLVTSNASNFSVSLEPSPYRLVVEVRKSGVKSADRAPNDLFSPANPQTSSAPSQSPALDRPSIPQTTSASPGIQAQAVTPRLRIVLDPGHGGWDLGTVGRKGLLEKDLVLDITERLGALIEKKLGGEVVYTRTDDNYVALEKRAELANVARADLFLSIHANYSASSEARGVETYYTNTYSSIKARSHDEETRTLQNINWTHVDIRQKVLASRQFAVDVQHALYGVLSTDNPGLRNRGVKKAQYVVLTGTSMPAILAEVSFVSSPADEDNLQNPAYRQRIAEALFQGLAHYSRQSDRGKTTLASASDRSSVPR